MVRRPGKVLKKNSRDRTTKMERNDYPQYTEECVQRCLVKHCFKQQYPTNNLDSNQQEVNKIYYDPSITWDT